MRRLVHLSDLHFGRERPELLDPLIEQINDLAPDLVAISGDLTQRARHSQFRRARELIDRLESEVLVVPGNHDTPLDNVFERVMTPFRRYKKWISRDLEPQVKDGEWTVVGINTVNPLGWQSGWFDRHDIATVRKAFEATEPGSFRIIVVHHPMEHLPGEQKKLMRGAGKAIGELADLQTDVVLSGHLHSWRADLFASRVDHPSLLQVHAGTGLSHRLRGEENDYNLLTFDQDRVSVERFACEDPENCYSMVVRVDFQRDEDGWIPVDPP